MRVEIEVIREGQQPVMAERECLKGVLRRQMQDALELQDAVRVTNRIFLPPADQASCEEVRKGDEEHQYEFDERSAEIRPGDLLRPRGDTPLPCAVCAVPLHGSVPSNVSRCVP